jgi:hypothetical protein
MTTHGFPAATGPDGSCNVLRDRDTPEFSAWDTTLIDSHRWAAFEPSEYVTAGRSSTVEGHISDRLLGVLRNEQSRRFSHIVTENEPRFPCCCVSTQSYAKSPADVLLRNETLSPSRRFPQKQIQSISVSGCSCNRTDRKSTNTERRAANDPLLGQTDNSMCAKRGCPRENETHHQEIEIEINK